MFLNESFYVITRKKISMYKNVNSSLDAIFINRNGTYANYDIFYWSDVLLNKNLFILAVPFLIRIPYPKVKTGAYYQHPVVHPSGCSSVTRQYLINHDS